MKIEFIPAVACEVVKPKTMYLGLWVNTEYAKAMRSTDGVRPQLCGLFPNPPTAKEIIDNTDLDEVYLGYVKVTL